MTSATPAPPIAVPFDLGSLPLLSAGQSRLTLVKGDRLTSHAMVIAEGGENSLHAHRNEEHIFLVLAGQARFEFLPPARARTAGAPAGHLDSSRLFLQLLQRGRAQPGVCPGGDDSGA